MGANDINARDLFGHGVFNLHARVYLDEVKLTGVHIHQELDRSCALVVHMFADFFAEVVDGLTLGPAEVGGRRALDDLLVAALHRAVTLIEVINLAVAVAEDLHLNVARTGDHFLKIAFAVAKGGFGLTAAL